MTQLYPVLLLHEAFWRSCTFFVAKICNTRGQISRAVTGFILHWASIRKFMHRYLLPKILCQITFQKFLHFVNGTVVVDDIIWDYKYMIFHILRSYGIIKPTEKWNVPNNERILKAVQYLSLINLIKPAKVYVLAHHWHNLTAVSKVPWKEQSSAGTLSQYSSNNNNYYYHYISLLPKSLFYGNREKEHPLLQDSFVEFHTVAKYDLHFYMFSTKAGLSIAFFGSFYEEWLLWFEFVVLVSHQGVAPGIPRKLLSGTFLVCALHVLCTGFSLCDNKQDLPCIFFKKSQVFCPVR